MISCASDLDTAALDAFVQESPGANVYHLSGWRRIFAGVFGQRSCCLLSRNGDGRINGLLPIVQMRSWLFGDFMVSMPYVNYGGPCTDDPHTAAALIAEGARLAADRKVRHFEVRTESSNDCGLQVRTSKVSMRLPLPSSAETLWKDLGSKLRSQVKRAEREQMTVRVGGLEELDAFYSVFAANMRDLGTPVYSRQFFAAILREFPERTAICVVSHGAVHVAAGFLVGFRGTLEIPWASSLKSYSRLGPNMLLYWNALRYGCEQGYRIFDFGRSSPDSGTYRFKEQWGATPVPLHWHYWVPDGHPLPELNPANPKYQLAIRMWRRLPLPLTKLIGPSIVRNLP